MAHHHDRGRRDGGTAAGVQYERFDARRGLALRSVERRDRSVLDPPINQVSEFMRFCPMGANGDLTLPLRRIECAENPSDVRRAE